MAKKNAIPMPTGGGVLPKLIGFAVLVALCVVVVKYPADAASWVQGLASGIGWVIESIAAFIRHIAD